MLDLCEDANFKSTTPISERLEDVQYRMELLLRFFVLHKIDVDQLRGIKDLSEFLDIRNRVLANDKNSIPKNWSERFARYPLLLNEALGDDSFRKYDSSRGPYSGDISSSRRSRPCHWGSPSI